MPLSNDVAKAVGTPIGIGIAVILVAGVTYYFLKKEIKAGAAAAGDALGNLGGAINPVSDQNIFYQGVGGIGTVLTGDPEFSLGGWIYDKLHPDQADPNKQTSGTVQSNQPFWTYHQQVGAAAGDYSDLLNERSYF